MARFLAVFAIFVVAHAVPALPAVRQPLRQRLGSAGYLAAYSLLSLLLFAWLLRELPRAPFIPLWFAGPVAHGITVALVPAALALLGASVLAPNPRRATSPRSDRWIEAKFTTQDWPAQGPRADSRSSPGRK